MRRLFVALLAWLTVAVFAPSATPQVPEPEPFCEMFPTGQSYGLEHVAPAARAGIVGHEHIPGTHLGFSQCVP